MYPTSLILSTLLALLTTSLTRCNQTETSHHRVRRIVGGEAANYPPYDDPVVYVRFNGRSARVQGVREFPHYVFKGIKYAFSPVGADRFLRPKEKFLEGEIKATLFPPPCIQPVPGKNMIIGSEDCLALNIFTPDLPTGTEGLPVVVWIHGGGFRYGSASQYGVKNLVGQRLLVVTIQYRLGSLGFLSSASKHLPGNAALWDMALAVQWVRNYIGFFGGNPHKIVVMGHDTGASSSMLLGLSKIAKGQPSGIIAMSGTAVSRWAIDNTPMNTVEEIAEQNGCPTTNVVTTVKCLQNVPAASIIKGDSSIEFQRLQSRGFTSGLNGRMANSPVMEGANDGRAPPGFVERDPVEHLYMQDNPKIPLLTGITKDETKTAVKGHYKQDIIKQLTSVPDFLNKVLIQNLQDSPVISTLAGKLGDIGKIGNISLVSSASNILGNVGNILPLNFDNYLKMKTSDVQESLDKIAEVTADALFNVPAFLTAQFWKDAPTFLYSFEHIGKMKKGSAFLQGLSLIGNSSTDSTVTDAVSHGDELAYLFDAQDLEGNPLPSEEPTEDDMKVRQVFTKMIADFVRHGEINVNNKKAPPFNVGENNFIQIKPEPILANKFKFCEMALWTHIGERLKSSTCQFLKAFDPSSLTNTLLNPTQNLGNVVQPINNLGLLGGNGQQNTQNNLGLLGGNNEENMQNNLGLLGGNNQQNNLGLLGGNRQQNKKHNQNTLGLLGGSRPAANRPPNPLGGLIG